MEFVKTSVYVQEYTEAGIREKEVDARKKSEIEADERLKNLPEFNRDPNFRSLAEQLKDNEEEEALTNGEKPGEVKINPFATHAVTEDEYEFYESLRLQERSRNAARAKEEKDAYKEFANARKSAAKKTIKTPEQPSLLNSDEANDIFSTSITHKGIGNYEGCSTSDSKNTMNIFGVTQYTDIAPRGDRVHAVIVAKKKQPISNTQMVFPSASGTLAGTNSPLGSTASSIENNRSSRSRARSPVADSRRNHSSKYHKGEPRRSLVLSNIAAGQDNNDLDNSHTPSNEDKFNLHEEKSTDIRIKHNPYECNNNSNRQNKPRRNDEANNAYGNSAESEKHAEAGLTEAPQLGKSKLVSNLTHSNGINRAMSPSASLVGDYSDDEA